MPQTQVHFYQEHEDDVPVWEWLTDLARRDRKAAVVAVSKIQALRLLGYELRRPNADYLRDGIYELRFKRGRLNYRILYFFSGRNVVVVSHGIAKESEVPDVEINRAVERKQRFEANHDAHTYRRSK